MCFYFLKAANKNNVDFYSKLSFKVSRFKVFQLYATQANPTSDYVYEHSIVEYSIQHS